MIINVRHAGICVTDLPRAVEFYSALGFNEISRDTETGHFIEQVTGIDEVRLEWVKLTAKDGFMLELLQYHSHPKPAKVTMRPPTSWVVHMSLLLSLISTRLVNKSLLRAELGLILRKCRLTEK